MSRGDGDDGGTSSLAHLTLAVQSVLAVGFAALFLLVGVTPDGWGIPIGLSLAVFSAYHMLRGPIERRLTGPQEWGVFALVGVLALVGIAVETGELTDEALVGLVAFLGVAAVFGYRAVARR